MALIPGISRSASTISCAQVLGWNSKEAVRFSFLLAIPTIVGNGVALEGWKLWKKGATL
jgi:undecaprenyl-diphosphatase